MQVRLKLSDLELVLEYLRGQRNEAVEIALFDETTKGAEFSFSSGNHINTIRIFDAAAGITPELKSISKLYRKS